MIITVKKNKPGKLKGGSALLDGMKWVTPVSIIHREVM